MRVLNSSEALHIAGGSDDVFLLLFLLPPERREAAIHGVLTGHAMVYGGILAGGLSACAMAAMTPSAPLVIGTGLVGAVAGGALTYSYLSNYFQPSSPQ